MLSPRLASPTDLGTLLGWFDERVAWLTERGINQWGSDRVSANVSFVERARGWIVRGEVYLVDGLGAVVLSDEPPTYASEGWIPGSKFISALITAPIPESKGVGRQLLRWAEARVWGEGHPAVRLDCWADGDFLQGYYESAGYVQVGEFFVSGWHGAVMEKRHD